MSERIVRDLARKAVETGRLPNRRPDRTWGGPGTGAACVICGAPVTPEEIEYEIEFSGQGGHRVHVGCFAAWDRERQHAAGAARSRADAAHALSPGSEIVPATASGEAATSLRVLSSTLDHGNISGRGRDPTYKRRPA